MDEHGNFFVATPIPPSTSSVSCSSIVVYMEGLRQEFPRAPHGHGRRLHEWFLLSSGLTPARLSGAGLGGRAWKVQASLLGVVLIAGSPGGKWNGCQGWRQPSRSDAVGALYSRGTSATLIQLGRGGVLTCCLCRGARLGFIEKWINPHRYER